MKVIIYFILIGSLFSCVHTPPNFYNYIHFPEEKTLQGEILPLDSIFLRYPYRIKVKDSIAIIMDYHNYDHFYHAISYPDGKHVASFGNIGEEWEEMSNCESMTFVSMDSIWVLDPNRSQIKRWSLSGEKNHSTLKETIGLDPFIGPPLNFQLADSIFIIPDYQGENRFILVSKDGTPTHYEGFIPTKKNRKVRSKIALTQAWRSYISYHQQKDIVAMATQLGEVLEIYHLKDSTYKVIYGPHKEPEFKTYENEYIPNGIMGFLDVQVTDKHIYTVFDGQTFKEINKALLQGTQLPPAGGKFIYVFDLEGNPVRKYILDHYVSGIDVHEDKRIIFATDVNSNEPILQFKF